MIVLPGDPKTTMYVKQISLIAGLVARPTVYFITSDHWRKVYAELEAQYMDALLDPKGPIPWRVKDEFKIGPLTVINSGIESQKTVNKMNAQTPGAIDFIERRDTFRIA
jgi:hypothetical protein